jgi:hypothetical protein
MAALVARGMEPTAGDAERSGEGGFGGGGGPSDYDKTIRQCGGSDEYNKRFVVGNLFSK